MIVVVATVSGSDEDSEITSLWHRCLGPAVEVVTGIGMILVKDIGRH